MEPAQHSPSSYDNSSTSTTPVQTPPLTPNSITRSDPSSPYPTTFVQADRTSFKQLVQMLTSDPPPKSASDSNFTFSKISIPPIRNPQKKQPSPKLYERRNQLRNNLMTSNNNSLSPSKFVLSRVTPLTEDIFNNAHKSTATPLPADSISSEEEEKAIAEKGFYFHPSPRASTTPKGAEPQLLSLFPVTAQRVSNTS